jgi:hypothetical protein
MNYKRFSINVVEHEPGKWRAQITPAARRRRVGPRTQLANSVDHSSAVEAMTKAMEMIDALSLSRNIRGTERHWRCLSKPDRKLGVVTRGKIDMGGLS